MNETLQTYCREHQVEWTRSRAYRKNDQAWVAQKMAPWCGGWPAMAPERAHCHRDSGAALPKCAAVCELFPALIQLNFHDPDTFNVYDSSYTVGLRQCRCCAKRHDHRGIFISYPR
jgi:hypothetical protein